MLPLVRVQNKFSNFISFKKISNNWDLFHYTLCQIIKLFKEFQVDLQISALFLHAIKRDF